MVKKYLEIKIKNKLDQLKRRKNKKSNNKIGEKKIIIDANKNNKILL
jgi:hypothetical protein